MSWYRDPSYKGKLTEAEKQELDRVRALPRHPAAKYEDLPDEVQSYIAGLSLERYDLKQERAVALPLLCTLFALVLIGRHHFSPPPLSTAMTWTLGLALLVVPWFIYRYQWAKISREEFPGEGDAAPTTDELLRREWEVSYIVDWRKNESTN
jgi:hypothetical protein